METLIAFHFSLLPFFDSKTDSDKFLMFQSEDSTVAAADQIKNELLERWQNLDTIFVKTIFPFIERREFFVVCLF